MSKKKNSTSLIITVLAAAATFVVIFSVQRYFFSNVNSETPSLCYLSNEGFSVSAGDKMVLMDAFYSETFPEDKEMPEAIQKNLVEANPPFDGTDLITVSHAHVDHFDAEMIMAHMTANPNAYLLLTPEAKEKFMQADGSAAFTDRMVALYPERGKPETITVNGLDLTVYNLDHRMEVENIGVMFELGGKTFFHMADLLARNIEGNGLEGLEVDYLLIPYWYFLEDEAADMVTSFITARYIVPIHIPRPDAPEDFQERIGGWNNMIEGLKARRPNMLVMVDDGLCVSPEQPD